MKAVPSSAPVLQSHYILPMSWTDDANLSEVVEYIDALSPFVDVIVVDGSPEPLRTRHASSFSDAVTVIDCNVALAPNGKVAGIHTALPLLRWKKTTIADDDVKYSPAGLRRVLTALETCDLAVPQNVFSSADRSDLPWHAKWDTARSLINRAFASDYPGTLAVRTNALLPGYDGDVLFENLELMRTVRARGGRVRSLSDYYVDRCPPSAKAFLSQRVRQAYDSRAQPQRWALELALAPMILLLVRKPLRLLFAAVLSVVLAEAGRRRAGGRSVYSADSALWAPLWLTERAVCSWLALGSALRGGARYRGRRFRTSAHSLRTLRSLEKETSRVETH